MKVEIPRDIKDLITGSHPATLSTQIPGGLNFDGGLGEVTINGCADVRWDRAIPPECSLRFHFTADDHADAGLIARFNGYFDRCRELVAAQGPGVPAGYAVLTIHDNHRGSKNERGAGFCTGLPKFERSSNNWAVKDTLERLYCGASKIDFSKPVKLVAVSWDPNLGRLMGLLGSSMKLDNVGTLEIGKATIDDFMSLLFFPSVAGAIPTWSSGSPARAASGGTVKADMLYRVELVIPTPLRDVGAGAFADTLFAALSFASGFHVDFTGTAIVQNSCAIYVELKPGQGDSPEPFCPPVDWAGKAGGGAQAATNCGATVAEIASLFFRRIAADVPLIEGGPRSFYSHPLVGAISELADAMHAVPAGDLYLAVKRVHAIVPAAIEMIAKCYELDSSGQVLWQPLRPSRNLTQYNTLKNKRIRKLIGDNAHNFWGKIRNPLAHGLRLMEDEPPDPAPGGHASGYSVHGFLSERGQEFNARFRDLWKVQRFLLTMINHVVLRVIGYTGNATNWADKSKKAYSVSGGNAPVPQASDFETSFARKYW